jgi:hypothetical protein
MLDNRNTPFEISLNKRKLRIIFIVSLLLLIKGAWWFMCGLNDIEKPWLVYLLSGALLGVTGLMLLSSVASKVFDSKPAISVNSYGIIDNSSILSQGLILWENIEDVKGIMESNDWLMLLVLKRPEEFIKRTKNPLL